ncbi:hypothetical protein [Methylocapsa aurea]|uniref:hypothetical protein n=1 Tax=Methylocapsa aurea TaxID=663610 RepID=UPI00055A7A63|nr:hypothetical protein [Methylocapsa aurea]
MRDWLRRWLRKPRGADDRRVAAEICEPEPRPRPTTQSNLDGALAILAVRESSPEKLKEAVAAFRLALKGRALARAPLQWAQTQENLALAYLALFNKTGEPAHFDNALAAISAALNGYRKAKAPTYIEKANRLQEEIFAAKRK